MRRLEEVGRRVLEKWFGRIAWLPNVVVAVVAGVAAVVDASIGFVPRWRAGGCGRGRRLSRAFLRGRREGLIRLPG